MITLAETLTSARQHGLTAVSHLICLQLLGDDNSLMTDIATACGVSSAAATGIVDRLEKNQLACRTKRTPGTDRRVVNVQITAKGRAAIAAIRLGKPPAVPAANHRP